MYFLIDYENVNFAGLEGTEFIGNNDTVIIFFSNCCSTIQAYRMMDIHQSHCKFEICKLKNRGKNAMDFYIATKVGEIFANDGNARVAIVSIDKDFAALVDYWNPRLKTNNQIVRGRTIAKCISYIDGEKRRKKIVNDMMDICYLENEFVKYEENRKVLCKMQELFIGTEYQPLINSIVEEINKSKSTRGLYLNMLKSFGRKQGVDIYRIIKKYIAFKKI